MSVVGSRLYEYGLLRFQAGDRKMPPNLALVFVIVVTFELFELYYWLELYKLYVI